MRGFLYNRSPSFERCYQPGIRNLNTPWTRGFLNAHRRGQGEQQEYEDSNFSRSNPLSRVLRLRVSACHPCRDIWVRSRLPVWSRVEKPERKNSELPKKRGGFEGAIRILLLVLLFFFNDLVSVALYSLQVLEISLAVVFDPHRLYQNSLAAIILR